MHYHPQNTGSCYTTKINQTIELEGHWEVGLVESSLPSAMENVLAGHSYYTLQYTDGRVVKVVIPPGLYQQSYDMVKILHDAQRAACSISEDDEPFVIFRFPARIKRFTMKISDLTPAVIESIRFSPDLARMLGFDGDITYRGNDEKMAGYVADFTDNIDLVYIYCDLLEPVLIGDTKAPLLRISGRGKHRTYNPVQYVPLQKKCFDTVEINIMTDTGLPVPFLSGKSVVVLEFRRALHPYFLI